MAQRRPATEKAKATRQRSWTKNQEAKRLRIEEQKKREEYNRKVGTTGKQRANQARKVAKRLDSALANSAAGNTADLGDFTQYTEMEDLLEQ